MMAQAATNIHSQLVEIIADYLGPAGERFINRQIKFHLNKKPDQLTIEDLDALKEWVKVSLALLTNDQTIVDKCIERINHIKQ